MNDELFCIGDDNYKPNVAYVVGLSKDKLYSHVMEDGVVYVPSPFTACAFEHMTDAEIQIHGLIKDGIAEAGQYKVYKATCEIRECENYTGD